MAKAILPNKCLLNEKNFTYIIYEGEGWKKINNDYLIKYGKKYGYKDLSDEDKTKLYEYFDKNYNIYHIFNEQFMILINYLLDKPRTNKDSSINDCISKANNDYINFHKFFLEYFEKIGKEITTIKLLDCISYIDFLCFNKLKENIDKNFNKDLDDKTKKEIENYFNKEHKDKIITKKEIAVALRKYILKIILDNNRKEKDYTTLLYKNLYRKDLWNSKIFNVADNNTNFEKKIEKYLSRFSLKTIDSLAFYNIIGKEELELFNNEQLNYRTTDEQKNLKDNLNFNIEKTDKKRKKGMKIVKK